MIILLLSVERFVARRALDFTRPEYWDWSISGKAAFKEAPKCEVLCFGSSLTEEGIVPRVVQDRTGRRTHNLSICWGQAPAEYFLLRRALRAGARPSAVIVEFHPACLAGSYWSAVRFWPDLLSPFESLDLAWSARDAEFLATIVLGHFVPSIKNRFQIHANIRAALEGRKDDLASATLTYMRNKRQNHGALLGPKNEKYGGEIAASYETILAPETWTCDPINALYVRRFLELAQAQGVAVYWLLPPLCPALEAKREQKGLDELYTRFARSFLDKFPNLVVLDARRSSYDAQVFLDAAHLDIHGACALSSDIGEILRPGSGREATGSRWVALPAYRDQPPTVAVEDLEQSGHVLSARWGKRR